MRGVLVGRFEHRSDDWFAARAGRLGGSEIAAVLGLSEWESPFSLWHRKAGTVEPVEETAPMEWGGRLEPVIVAKFLDQHPEYVAVPGGTYRHPDFPRHIANPDQLLAENPTQKIPVSVLEVKTASAFDAWKWADPAEDPEGIPVYYRAQVLWYGDVLGLPTVHVAVLIGGSDYREYVIDVAGAADEVDDIRARAIEFLDSIDHGIAPPLDGSTHTYQVLRELHPDIDDVDVDLHGDLVYRFAQAVADLKAAEAEEHLARSLVAEAMGTARRARFDGRPVATRQTRGDGAPFVVAAKTLTTFLTTQETAA